MYLDHHQHLRLDVETELATVQRHLLGGGHPAGGAQLRNLLARGEGRAPMRSNATTALPCVSSSRHTRAAAPAGKDDRSTSKCRISPFGFPTV